MKACSYFGRKNEPDALACFECGTGFPVTPTEEDSTNDQLPLNADVATAKPEAGFQIAPPIPDLLELDMRELVEGFSRPNWKTVNEYILQRVSPQDLSAAWELAAQKWLEQLAKDLGGGHACITVGVDTFVSELLRDWTLDKNEAKGTQAQQKDAQLNIIGHSTLNYRAAA